MFHRTVRTGMLLFLLMLLAVAAPDLLLAAGGDLLWTRNDPQGGKQEPLSAVSDSRHDVIMAGFRNLAGGVDDDYWVVKYAADGSGVLWRFAYDRSGGSDQAVAVAVDSSDDVIVTGTVWNGLSKDIHTIKLSGQTGQKLWEATYDGTVHGNDVASSVTVDQFGSIYVAGYSQSVTGDDDAVLIRYAPDGSTVWTRSYAGNAGGNDQIFGLTAASGRIFCVGRSWNGSQFDAVTLAWDASGDFIWERRHPAPAGSSHGAGGRFIAAGAGGSLFIAGYTSNTLDRDILVARLSASDGAVVWERVYNGAFDDDASAISVDPSGDLFLTGSTWTLSGANDFYTARYAAATGAPLWEKGFDSGGGNSDVSVPTGLVFDPEGDIFVTGYTVTGTNFDIQTIRYRKDSGTELWHRSFDGGSGMNDRPVGIFLTADGDLLVAGWSQYAGTDVDTVLLSYDSGALNPPTSLSASVLSSTSVLLSWEDNSANEESFRVERRRGEFGGWTEIAQLSPDVTTFTDTGLDPDTLYFYRVRSWNGTDGFSHYSNEAHLLTVFSPVVPVSWIYRHNGPDNLEDVATAVAVGTDDNPVVTGYSLADAGGFDYLTLKIDRSSGSLVWSDRYDSPDNELDKATCVAVDSGNNPVVSGFSSLYFPPAQGNINSIYTLKYGPDGAPSVWGAQYNGPGGIDDRAVAIATATDSSGNVHVLGYGRNGAGNEDIYLVKYSPAGSLLWAMTPFDGGGTDIPSSLAVGPDGSVYVTGMSEMSPGSNRHGIFVARYDGATGGPLWIDRYQPVPGGDSRGAGIAIGSDGGLYVTGFTTTSTAGRDIVTIRYDSAATAVTRLWERFHDGPAHGDDTGVSVRVDPIDGAVVVGGTISASGGDHEFVILRYAPDGSLLWDRTLLRPAADDTMTSLVLDPSGYIYAAGTTVTGTTADVLAAHYDFEGTLLGVTTHGGAAGLNDEATSLAVNNRGEAFVSGYSENADGSADYLVLKITNTHLLAPSPFSVVPQTDYSQMLVSWGVNSSAAAFRLERSTGYPVSESDWSLIGEYDQTISSHMDTGLNPGTLYCYRITAYTQNQSSRKPVLCRKTRLVPPVLNPVLPVSSTSNDLSWNLIPGNTEYRVQRREADGGWILVQILPANTTSWRDTGLTAGRVYSYRVRVVNESGGSLFSNVQPVPVLNPVSSQTTTTLSLSWPAIPDVTGYLLERSVNGIDWNEIASLPAATLTWNESGLAPGSVYQYRLRGITPVGPSAPSLTVTGQTRLVTPAITSITTSSPTSLTVSWSDTNTNEEGYALELSASYSPSLVSCQQNLNNDSWWNWAPWTRVATLPPGSTSFTVSSLPQNYPARFRVVALKGGGDSLPSVYALGVPQLVYSGTVTLTALDTASMKLSWNTLPAALGYQIVKDGVTMTGPDFPLSYNTYEYTVTGLQMGVDYCFRLRMFNDQSEAFSSEVCGRILPPPVITSLVQTQTTIQVNWNQSPGATAYELSYADGINGAIPTSVTEPADWWRGYSVLAYSIPSSTTQYQVSGLTPGYAYKFQLRYRTADGKWSPFSDQVMTVTNPTAPTTQPPTYPSTTSIGYSWNYIYNYPNFEYQHRQRETSSCSTEEWSSTPIVPVSATAITINGLTPDTPYCLRVRTVGRIAPSPWTVVSSYSILPAPVLLDPTGITMSSVSLSWQGVAGASGYGIERSINGTTWTQVGTTDGSTTSWTDLTVMPATTYYYRVSTKNGGGVWSIPSNVRSAATPAVTAPVFQGIDSVTVSSARLLWSGVEGNAGYRIERSLDNTSWSQIVVTAPDTVQYTDEGLSPGTRYYYRVSTRIPSGGLSSPSAVLWTVTTPSAPAVAGETYSSDRIDLRWQVVRGAASYRIYRSVGPAGPWDLAGDHAIPYSTDYCGASLPSVACPAPVPVQAVRSVSSLAAGIGYCFRVKSWNETGGESVDSNTVCLSTSSLNGPLITSLVPSGGMKISLQWEYSPSSCTPTPCITPEGFEIWRRLSNGIWARITTVGNTTSHVDSIGIEPQKRYTYRVRAFAGSDFSAFSPEVSVTTSPFSAGDGVCP